MSCHAINRWRERVGKPIPSPEELGQLINESVTIQKARNLFTPRGYTVRILTLYWHQDLGIVFKVDHVREKVVTVLAPKVVRKRIET